MRLFDYIDIDFKHIDDRGKLIQLVHKGFEQVNVLISHKNVVRGGHYHKKCKEAFFVLSGSVNVQLNYQTEQESVVFKEGDFFCIKPNVIHCMDFPEECVMIQMYDLPVENDKGEKDIFAVK